MIKMERNRDINIIKTYLILEPREGLEGGGRREIFMCNICIYFLNLFIYSKKNIPKIPEVLSRYLRESRIIPNTKFVLATLGSRTF